MFESISQNFGVLRQPVGNNLKNEPEDVLEVKRTLAGMGRLTLDSRKGEPHGYITREMDQEIRRFQKERGLKIDGVMFPGGETERVLISERSASKTQTLPQAAENESQIYGIDPSKGAASVQLWKQYLNPGKKGQKNANGDPVRGMNPAYMDKFYKKEMEDNNRRFIDSMVKGYVDNDPNKRSPLKERILKLRDGESVTLTKGNGSKIADHWDKDVTRKRAFMKSLDEGLGFGAAKINSTGTLHATRRGDVIEIEGAINHNFNDRYDFNHDTAFDRIVFSGFRWLDNAGKAKPFYTKGTKTQNIKGKLQIKDGKIDGNSFVFWESGN